MKTQAQRLEEVQSLGWDSIEQCEEARRFYAAEKSKAKEMYAAYLASEAQS